MIRRVPLRLAVPEIQEVVTPRTDDTGSRRLPVSAIQGVKVGNLEASAKDPGVDFRLRISPRIRSQNSKGLNAYVC